MTIPANRADDLAALRSHLANERTLLAYVRTSLGFVAAGLAVIGFAEAGLPPLVGWTLMAAGGLVIIVGLARFVRFRARILPVLFAAALLAAPAFTAENIPLVPNAVKEAQKSEMSYGFLLSDSWKGEEDAIGELFRLLDIGFFEGKGKAEQEHRLVLWTLLKHHGDARFIVALDREYPRLQEAIVRAIALEAGVELARYPKTAARRNANQ